MEAYLSQPSLTCVFQNKNRRKQSIPCANHHCCVARDIPSLQSKKARFHDRDQKGHIGTGILDIWASKCFNCKLYRTSQKKKHIQHINYTTRVLMLHGFLSLRDACLKPPKVAFRLCNMLWLWKELSTLNGRLLKDFSLVLSPTMIGLTCPGNSTSDTETTVSVRKNNSQQALDLGVYVACEDLQTRA